MAREKTKELLPVMENNANFVQVIPQSKEEKVAMYMKHSKKEIIEMLIHCNENLELKTTKNEKSANEEQEYINFGCYYNDGGYNTIYKSGCNFEDFKTETLDICKNFSKKDRENMYNTYNIIKKIIVKLIENGWHIVNAKDATIEEAVILDATTRTDVYWKNCYKQHVELFGKKFIDSIIDNK